MCFYGYQKLLHNVTGHFCKCSQSSIDLVDIITSKQQMGIREGNILCADLVALQQVPGSLLLIQLPQLLVDAEERLLPNMRHTLRTLPGDVQYTLQHTTAAG